MLLIRLINFAALIRRPQIKLASCDLCNIILCKYSTFYRISITTCSLVFVKKKKLYLVVSKTSQIHNSIRQRQKFWTPCI